MAIELAALGGSLAQFVLIIQDLGNNYFRADAASKGFPLRVELLRNTHNELQEKMQRYGLRQKALVEAVKEAKELLDREVAVLKKRSQASPCTCFWIRGTLFPASVGLQLGLVEDAYSKISVHLDTNLRNNDVFAETAQRRPFVLPFHDDSRYVPLDTSEKSVFSALEKKGPYSAVVLLSGGSGKGKSTLARKIGLRYTDGNSKFTQVIMLECGPNLDVEAKQTELLQKLGGDLSQQSQGVDYKVLKSLQDRLSNPELLVILDDLWEPELICRLVNYSAPGSGAKFLVTSQVGNICASLACKTPVQIEDLTQDVARKILASHAGFEDQKIPRHLQDVADNIIVQAEANPLVLATLGAHIAKAARNEMEVWESVSEDLSNRITLYGETPAKVHESGYERSFLATMKISTGVLDPKQKLLLVLMGMCRGPSISKSALQFLYSSAILHERCNRCDFLIVANDLKRRHLLAENDTELFSIHSLTKFFILNQMWDSVKDVATLLNEANVIVQGKSSDSTIESSVTHVLVYFYIDAKEVRKRATIQNDSDLLMFNPPWANNAKVELKRTTSESIMQLLVLNARPSNNWTEELSICAKQVLVDFVCNDLLCDGDISKLLASATAKVPMLTFFKNVCLLETSFWKKNSLQTTSSIPRNLLNILQDDSCAEDQTKAASVLADLCWCCKDNSETIANLFGMLPQLAIYLGRVQSSDLQRSAAHGISACAFWDDRCGALVSKILDVPGLLSSLVDLLAKDENTDVQSAAVHALSNVASGTSNGELALRPGLLEGLTNLLVKGDNHFVQKDAAFTLANIANTDEKHILDVLFNHSRLVDNLVRSLYDDQNSGLQSQSARALGYLTRYRTGSSRYKVVNWPGLLEGLAKLLLKAQNPSVQANAARAIFTLASETKEDAETLVNHSGLLDNLVKLLDENQNFCVQAEAMTALLHLTDIGKVNLRAKIWSFPRWFDGLAGSLLEAQNPPLQQTAAEALAIFTARIEMESVERTVDHSGLVDNIVMVTASLLQGENSVAKHFVLVALNNLAVTTDTRITDKIVDAPGLLEKLAKSLTEDQRSNLQIDAARAIENLARYSAISTISNKLVTCPGLLEGLVESLLKTQDPSLQQTAAEAIAILTARIETETVGRIVNQPAIMDNIVKLLDESKNSGVQAAAAWALLNLTQVGEGSVGAKVVTSPRLLEKLTASLLNGENSKLEECRVGIFGNVAVTTEKRVLEKIVESPGLVDKLVKSLVEDQRSELQSDAARALRNLAGYDAERTIRNKLANWPGLLDALTESLLRAQNPSLQQMAAETIGIMADGIEGTVDKIVNHPGLVNTIVKLLDESENSDVQAAVARALLNLTYYGNDSLRVKIVSSPRLVEKLTAAMLKNENSDFEEDVVGIVGNLAFTRESRILDKIIESPGLVYKLSSSLAEERHSVLQTRAATALLSLAGDKDNEDYDISRFPGLLERLTEALLRDGNLALRETVTTALTCLRATNKATVDKGVDTWGQLDKLIKRLTTD